MKVTSRTFLFQGLLLSVLGTVLLSPDLDAAEVKIFRADTHDTVAQGKLDALSLDPLGALELARRVERLAMPEEAFVFTAAPHPEGWVLGTGNSGKVLLVRASGAVEELYAASEPTVFALAVDDHGTVYAGTSPYGKVYRLPPRGGSGGETQPADGEPTAIFDPEDAYIWDLELDSRGRLLVATGLTGRLYRVETDRSAAEQTAAILYETTDSHVRAIHVLADGRVLLGTAGQGLLLELIDGAPAKGKKGAESTVAVATLYDAVQPEILAFTSDPEGTAYAAVLASEASLVDLSKTLPPPQNTESEGDDAKVTVSTGHDTVGSRSADYTGPRSLILRIRPDGQVEELLSLQDETAHSILWHEGALWIGTGEEGHLYRYQDERLILERDLDERQITSLVAGKHGAAAVTTNAAALYRISDGRATEGTFTSQVLDAGQVARFGSFLWEGDAGPGGSLELEARSGLSQSPDATWTAWRLFAGKAASSPQEIALDQLAHGRYVQWRATLKGGGGQSPRLVSSELSYRQQNLKPQIESFEVLAPGQVLVPGSFSPQNQTYEPWSPNRDGIFTSLRPEKDKDNSRLKTLWKKGYRSLRWKASDANEDKLSYALTFCRDGDDQPWLEIVEKLEDTYYTFDSTVLPDGVYRFRLIASDEPGQTDGEALVADKISEPVVVDHSPPTLVGIQRKAGVLEVEIRDRLNPLRNVVYSVDAAAWESAPVADGLLDGRREVVKLKVPEGSHMVLLRATDAAFNVITFDLSSEESR